MTHPEYAENDKNRVLPVVVLFGVSHVELLDINTMTILLSNHVP